MGVQSVWGKSGFYLDTRKTASKAANDISLFFEENIFDKRILDKICNNWSKYLKKELMELAKSETPNWFKVRFSKDWTPLEIRYSRRSHKLYVFGSNPNMNVSNEFGKDQRKKIIGKRKPVFVDTGNEKGFWFTPKKFQPHNENGVFKSRTSHSTYEIHTRSDGRKFYTRTNARKYPFSAMWYTGITPGRVGESVKFFSQKTNVADWIFRYPQFEKILILTLAKAMDGVTIKEAKQDYVSKMTGKRQHHSKSRVHKVRSKGWIEHHELKFEENLNKLDASLLDRLMR